jgi:hypothetical protein
MPRFELVPGLRVESVGEAWVTWSPASGETHVLNDEAAAIVEVLAECGVMDAGTLVSKLVAEGVAAAAGRESLRFVVEMTWPYLISAGVVRPARESAA